MSSPQSGGRNQCKIWGSDYHPGQPGRRLGRQHFCEPDVVGMTESEAKLALAKIQQCHSGLRTELECYPGRSVCSESGSL